MDYNHYVLIGLWVVLPIVLYIVVPRDRIREAMATFMFFQMLTWLFAIGLTYAGLLEAPVRIFKHATKISFTMEYLVFPTAAVLFQLNFPENPRFVRRLLHYLFWVGIILLFMFVLGKFTDIMDVKIDNLIRSFFNFLIEIWLCRRYVCWLLGGKELEKVNPT
jgi:hypothetical protein